MKKVTLALALLFFSLFTANAQYACPPNLDFELGTYANWHYYTGSCCPLTTPTYSGYGTPDTSRIRIMSGLGTDPCCTFPVVPPGAGAYTLRIGNSSAGTGTPHSQKARYYVNVPGTSSSYRFFYRTATVLQDAGHVLSQQPRLEVRLFDTTTGAVLPCYSYDVTTSAPGTYSVSACGSTPVKCKAWTTHSVDLSSYAGSVVGIEFATSDCGVDGHFGYAYLDLNCGVFPTSVAATCGSTTVTLLGVPGFVYYTWYDSSSFAPVLGTTQNMTIPNPSVPTTYACVASPYPGFGCPDTFYVTALPLPSSFISGTVSASTSTACITSSVTVTYPGAPALVMQWESSPDSLSWTTIPGATNSSHNVGGIASTTFYRCVVSCLAASYSYTSPGKKINYASCCPGCELLPVRFWYDANMDCIKQSAEVMNGFPVLVRVDSNGIAIDTISATAGLNFPAYGPAGTIYKFTMIDTLLSYSCPTYGVIVDTIQSIPSFPYPIKKAGLICPPATLVGDLSVSLSTMSGKHRQVGYIYVYSASCYTSGISMDAFIDTLYLGAPYSITSYPPAVSIAGNKVTWNAPTPASHTVTFEYAIEKTGPMLPVGSLVCSKGVADYVAVADVDTTNNVVVNWDTVKGSFDPNFIDVTPAGCFDIDTEFQYTVHFENLGNDTAHNVYILDTLSSHLDPSTLRIVAATADMNITIFNQGGVSIVKFDFPNINLQDSSKHGLNDGAVIYKIKNRPGTALGTDIASRAGIYFDDNEVVMTNTVNNVKGCPVPEINKASELYNNSKVSIYPNPAKDELIIKSEAGLYKSFTITNTVGQVMIAQDVASPLRVVNIKSLPPGMYYVSMQAEGFSTMLKFIKN